MCTHVASMTRQSSSSSTSQMKQPIARAIGVPRRQLFLVQQLLSCLLSLWQRPWAQGNNGAERVSDAGPGGVVGGADDERQALLMPPPSLCCASPPLKIC
ncbi:unnamed protein product [Penicillium pancosmium]